MRVLLITERFPPQKGGVAAAAGRQAALLAPKLERLDVLQLSSELPPGRVERSIRAGFSLHRLGRAPNDEESLQLLLEAALVLARRSEASLIHGFYAVYAGYVATLAARRLGLPSVVSLRGNDVDRGMFQGSRAPFLLWTLSCATALAGVSREILERAGALSGRKLGLFRIPNGVDAERFSPGEPVAEHLGAFAGLPRPWLAFSGELRFKKGLPIILALAQDLARRGEGSLFTIGGIRTEERESLEKWRKREPEAAARLIEVPYIESESVLLSFYRAMDMFVFPSLWDGLPNALLEAMACGKPVVAARAGGIPEVVEDGRCGVLVAQDSLDRFPEFVANTLALPKPRFKALGRGARERVLDRFTTRKERNAILRVYRQALAPAASRPLPAPPVGDPSGAEP